MAKQQLVYIHGGESYLTYSLFLERLRTKEIWDLPGSHTKKWTNTLADDLGPDYEVFTPRMPNPENAKYEEWKLWFERHFAHLRGEVIFVGCSLGAMFLYKYFSTVNAPVEVKALILMAGVAADVETETFYADCYEFLPDMSALGRLMDLTDELHILHSTDDFVVPYRHAGAFAAVLPTATVHTYNDKNHFLVPEFPEFLTLIREIVYS